MIVVGRYVYPYFYYIERPDQPSHAINNKETDFNKMIMFKNLHR